MGWWRTGDGEDRISDGGADCLLSTLRHLAERSSETHGSRPTLSDVLAGAAAALQQRPEALVGDPASLPDGPAAVDVRMRTGPDLRVPVDVAAPDGYAVQRLFEAFDDVASDYLGSELARLPRLSELLAVLAFVLRVEAARFIEDAPAELPIDRITLSGQEGR